MAARVDSFTTIKRRDDDGSHHSASFTVAGSNSKNTGASWEDETEDAHEIKNTATETSTPAPEKSSCSVLVTVSDEELGEVTLVSDSRFGTEEKLDALMRNLFRFGDHLGSRTRRTCGCGERLRAQSLRLFGLHSET